MTLTVLKTEAGYVQRDRHGRKFTHIYGDSREDVTRQIGHMLASFDPDGNPFYDTEEGTFTVKEIGVIHSSTNGWNTIDTHGVRCHWRVAVLLGNAVRPTNPRTRDWILKIS